MFVRTQTQADSNVKSLVVESLGWERLLKLLTDAHPDVEAQALAMVRNLTFGSFGAEACAL